MRHQHRWRGCPHHGEEGVLPLVALRVGEVATIRDLRVHDPAVTQKLLTLGVAPGVRVRVVQRFPAYVLEVGFAQIAVDHHIAKAVCVELDPPENTSG